MSFKRAIVLASAAISLFGAITVWAQPQSNYVFRFNAGVSSVMLNGMTFASQQALDLGTCQTTAKINDPFICAVNCDNIPVCLLTFGGPAGLLSTDILEKVSETPVGSTSSSLVNPEFFKR